MRAFAGFMKEAGVRRHAWQVDPLAGLGRRRAMRLFQPLYFDFRWPRLIGGI